MIPFPNISPEIFTISVAGIDLTLRWYALSYVVGFLIAIAVMRSFTGRGSLWRFNTGPLDRDQVDGLVTYLILGVILGGRIGYVLFYNFDYYLSNPGDIVRVWDGGMAFHGGFLGVVVATILYCRYNGIILWSCADLIALSAGPGIFLGRVANFINAELWGRPTDAPWGVVFPGARAQDCPGVVGECARHPSQLYEAGLEGLLLFTILVVLALLGALRRPGVVTGAFLIIYGVGRYVVEFYRVPDPQFFSDGNPYGFAYQFGDFGVTMGQTLSLPMIAAGLLLVLIKNRAPKYG